MTRFSGLWFVVYMLASVSLPSTAAAKKPAQAAAKKPAQAAAKTPAQAAANKPAAPAAPQPVDILRWSFDKWIPGMFCTKVDEPTDPHGWDDNFLCSSNDLGLRWSSLGPLSGMVCTRFEEGSDPDGWSDNYLCAPRDYGFRWSFWGPVEGMQCLQINEPDDPHTWGDNFLCWPAAGKGPLNAVTYPKNRADAINLIRARRNYQSYLELGQGSRGGNFDAIDSKIKIGVDPDRKLNAAFQMTVDEFFAQNKQTFDLIFINELRDAAQVEKAVASSLKVLNKGGTIVLRDCNPNSAAGDVWKAWVKLRATHDDLTMQAINLDTGLGIITRGKQTKLKLPAELTYQALDANRKAWLNLIEVNAFLKNLGSQ